MATEQEIMDLLEQQQYADMRQKLLQRNLAYAKPDWQSQMTQLPPEQEAAFNQWLQANEVQYNPNDKYPDYDMKGYYLSMQGGQGPQASVNTTDQQLHYPDTFKTPYHESFSKESQWATEGAPEWQGERLVAPSGELVFETPKAKE